MIYTIYRHADGQYHALNSQTGEDMHNGMHQPIRRVYSADLASYLHWLNVPFTFSESLRNVL